MKAGKSTSAGKDALNRQWGELQDEERSLQAALKELATQEPSSLRKSLKGEYTQRLEEIQAQKAALQSEMQAAEKAAASGQGAAEDAAEAATANGQGAAAATANGQGATEGAAAAGGQGAAAAGGLGAAAAGGQGAAAAGGQGAAADEQDTAGSVVTAASTAMSLAGGIAAANREEAAEAQSEQATPAPSNQHIADKESTFIVVNCPPDFCKVGDSVIPFDISRTLDHELSYAKTVFARGHCPTLTVNSIIQGVDGDCGSGVCSGTSLGAGDCEVISGSPTVRVEGKPVARNGDKVLMNDKNTWGYLQTLPPKPPAPSAKSSAPQAESQQDAGNATPENDEGLKKGTALAQTGQAIWNELKGATQEAGDIGKEALTGIVGASETAMEYLGFGGSSTAVDAARTRVHGAVKGFIEKIDKLPVYLGFGFDRRAVDEVQDQAHNAIREGFDEFAGKVTKARDERGFLASVVRSIAGTAPYVLGAGGAAKVIPKLGKKPDGGPDGKPEGTPDKNGDESPDSSNTEETPNGENASNARGQGTRIEPKTGKRKGKYSGREFDPEKAGGPIEVLDWKNAKIDREGIDTIKEHLSRMDHDPWNDGMLQRLDDIAAGKLEATDFDLKFYTHELREFDRLKNIGLERTHVSQFPKGAWENTHTATLEDFQLADKMDYNGKKIYSLYHPDLQQ